MMTDDLERVLAGVTSPTSAPSTTASIRARRAESQQVEAKLSYLRRMAQGRLDIVSAEIGRRGRQVR